MDGLTLQIGYKLFIERIWQCTIYIPSGTSTLLQDALRGVADSYCYVRRSLGVTHAVLLLGHDMKVH